MLSERERQNLNVRGVDLSPRGLEGKHFLRPSPSNGDPPFGANTPAAGRTASCPLEPDPEASRRILVVDDNRAIHDDFRKILLGNVGGDGFEDEDAAFFGGAAPVREKIQFELDFASQGNEALALVSAATECGRRYSVVFMDIRMPPGWDGIETTSRLWEVDPDLQVVLCTAYSDYSWAEMVRRLGRTDRLLILKKPFDIIEVIQCAHALTSKWALLQQARGQAASLESTVRSRTVELEKANASLAAEIAGHRRSQETLRLTQFSVDNAAEAIFRVAPDSGLLYANAATCRILGYTVAELRQLGMLDIVPGLRESGWQCFWDSLRDEGHRTFETRSPGKDGRQIPIELTVAYFQFAGQELLCVSARDITRRTKILGELSVARDEALESVRLKSRFLANMSHEIRTPMNGVIGMAEVLLHTSLDRDQQDYVNTIRKSADLLLNIINDLLDTSKIEAGNLIFETVDFDLGAVIEDTLDLVGGLARNKGLELAGCVPAGVTSHLRGDPGRLRQVLTNILANAVKFTERGEVILSVSPLAEAGDGDEVRLRFEVRDTGIGIAADACQRVFEPFVQADISDTRRYGGTGLGLSICRQIIEGLNGRIGVDSVPGEGSTFWFQLGFQKQAGPALLAGGPAFPAGLRVLVVDDNPTNRKILQLQLARLQLRSTGVAGGDEALALLRQERAGPDPYAVALLDMQMPGMDGLTLARSIKADPGIAATRLILLSSLGDPLAAAELAAAGVGAHLVKPVKQSRLQAALAAVFGRPEEYSPAVEEESVNSMSPPPHPLRILLAEDNPVNRKVTLLQLQRLGYSAGVAVNGVEVLRALEEVPYDVILMDCQMPLMDGFAATREIRRIHDRPIRIIALTANAMEGDRRTCLEAGMDAFVSKPVRPAELAAQLENCARLPAGDIPCPPTNAAKPVDLNRLLEISDQNPAILRQLCHDYLEQAEEILNEIASAIGRRASVDIRQLAHKLGGSSSSCGMSSIVGPLLQLERLGEPAPPGLALELHREATRQLARIRRFLFRYLAGESAGVNLNQP